LVKSYPALDVRCDAVDLMLAIVDDFSPTAVEELDQSVRVFFSNTADRDAARFALASHFPAAAVDVSDEDWARRSQENLTAVTVGRLTIVSSPESRRANSESRIPDPDVIVIVPSMGFGTGHHATTRLCLDALQAIDLTDAFVLDVGTGSGILAIAAVRLGAARALGIDNDVDAIQAARENLAQNPTPGTRHAARGTEHRAPSTQHAAHAEVTFELADLIPTLTLHEDRVDVITANLTAALLVRAAGEMQRAVRSGGAIIVSGLQTHERDKVARAFGSTPVVWERTEDEWVGLLMKKP
jgi:ribosomal protein L11 methyltransferase